LTFFREFCRKLKLSVEICKHELEEACLDGLEAASKQSSRDPATNSSQRDPNWAPEEGPAADARLVSMVCGFLTGSLYG
jgi:hypothetical protein